MARLLLPVPSDRPVSVLVGLLACYVALVVLDRRENSTLFDRIVYVVSRTTWYNATARPPILLVCVVFGWSVAVGILRGAGMSLELVLRPGLTLPTAATRRAAIVLLDLVLAAHLAYFVLERVLGSRAHWYLVSSVLLNVAFVALFLSPPALASAAECGNMGPENHQRGTPYYKVDKPKDAREDGVDELDELSSKALQEVEEGFLYPAQRANLARVVVDALVAPFAEVSFWHVIVADYATSFAKALGDAQIMACVAWSSGIKGHESLGGVLNEEEMLWELHRPVCHASAAHAVVLALPFWCRFMQCVRGFYDTRETKHVLNACKYLTALPLIYLGWVQKRRTISTLVLDASEAQRLRSWVVCAAAFNSTASFCWDVVVDWRLLQPKRRAIVLGAASKFEIRLAYTALILFNCGLRFVWAASIFGQHPLPTRGASMFFFEVAEIVRRSVWAVFRIEAQYITLGLPVDIADDPRDAASNNEHRDDDAEHDARKKLLSPTSKNPS